MNPKLLPAQPSKKMFRQSGLRPGINWGLVAKETLCTLAFVAAVVLTFGLAGWADAYSEQQHALATAQRDVELARAFTAGVETGRAQRQALNAQLVCEAAHVR
jgi:hypothetical protein